MWLMQLMYKMYKLIQEMNIVSGRSIETRSTMFTSKAESIGRGGGKLGLPSPSNAWKVEKISVLQVEKYCCKSRTRVYFA